MNRLDQYVPIVGEDVIGQLRQLGLYLKGLKVVHVNPRAKAVAWPRYSAGSFLKQSWDRRPWEVITGTPQFYQCTKYMHNALQGQQCSKSGTRS